MTTTTTHDELISRFDALDADLGKLLNRYRKVKRDRNALLEACKMLTEAIERDGTDGCGDLMWGFQGPMRKAAEAITTAESEE